MEKKKILILTATAGRGHLRAADAMKLAFEKLCPEFETKSIDILDYTNPYFKKFYADGYLFLMKNFPEIFEFMHDKMSPKKPDDAISKILWLIYRLNTGNFLKFLKETNPSLVLSTQFLSVEILSPLKKRGKFKFPFACTVTDFSAHPIWASSEVDIYFVGAQTAKQDLMKVGIAEERIKITGIPIDPIFSETKPREDLEKKIGVKPGMFNVLLPIGGFGAVSFVKLIEKLQEISGDFQILVMTGGNSELKKSLDKLSYKKPTKIFPFIENVDEVMGIADISISKAGGLTISEALAKSLPIIIVEPVYAQEAKNRDYLISEGAATSAKGIEGIVKKVEELVKNRKIVDKMRENVNRIKRPRASLEIVEEIRKKFPEVFGGLND